MSISKSKLTAIVAESTNLSENDVESIISATLDTIMDTLSKKDSVTIVGFGTFSVKHRSERPGKNPRTGEIITVKEAWVPTFKPGKKLRDAVAE